MFWGRAFVHENEDVDRREENYTRRGCPSKHSIIRMEEVWEAGNKLEKYKIHPWSTLCPFSFSSSVLCPLLGAWTWFRDTFLPAISFSLIRIYFCITGPGNRIANVVIVGIKMLVSARQLS